MWSQLERSVEGDDKPWPAVGPDARDDVIDEDGLAHELDRFFDEAVVARIPRSVTATQPSRDVRDDKRLHGDVLLSDCWLFPEDAAVLASLPKLVTHAEDPNAAWLFTREYADGIEGSVRPDVIVVDEYEMRRSGLSDPFVTGRITPVPFIALEQE
jgi:hypothetical protein